MAMSTSTSTAKATAESTTTSTSTSTSSTSPPNSSLGHTATAATPSTPKINTEWLSDELQKAPFTLENANKEDELRRAETEHRSRKSKVLSAEYKHINRYINFSSDTKSLLTRSAAATPSVSGYNSDEGNISSEALAIQVGGGGRQHEACNVRLTKLFSLFVSSAHISWMPAPSRPSASLSLASAAQWAQSALCSIDAAM